VISRHASSSIDVTRGLAALGVIWGHTIYGFDLPLELNGAFWVWIFLPISGFLVGKSFGADGYGLSWNGYVAFLRNRGLRIIPLAWLALALGFAIERGSGQIQTALPAAATQFLFVSPLSDMSLVGILWTVVAEVHFYIAAILLAPLFVRSKTPWPPVAFWLVSIIIARQWIPAVGDVLNQPRTFVGNLPLFVFGLALASPCFDRGIRLARSSQVVLTIVPIAVAWYLNNYHPDWFWYAGQYTRGAFGGGVVCALVVAGVTLVARPSGGRPAWLSQRILTNPLHMLAWCGFYTYGIYVYHGLLLKINSVFLQFPPGPQRLLLVLLALPLAPLSYALIEKPLLRFKRSRASTGAKAPLGVDPACFVP